jgi:CRP-like cAMP-binding protein
MVTTIEHFPYERMQQRLTSGRALPNRLLQMLPAADLALLIPYMDDVALQRGATLQGEEGDAVYFPLTGMISLVLHMNDGKAIETAAIGYEGGIGLLAGFGIPFAQPSSVRATVQVPGRALKIGLARFHAAASHSAFIREMIVRHHALLSCQLQQSLACNAIHGLEARLCRWLLQAHDLCHGETVPLTQEYLAQMAGVRRTTITLVAQTLKLADIVHYRRGVIRIIDREALETRACECYRLMRGCADKLLAGAQE